jgi:hypothetical protein
MSATIRGAFDSYNGRDHHPTTSQTSQTSPPSHGGGHDHDHDGDDHHHRWDGHIDHWGYVTYDPYRRPVLYNPYDYEVQYAYWYDGRIRYATVAPRLNLVLNIAVPGVFSFTAVRVEQDRTYMAIGTFNGGAWCPPPGWVEPYPGWAPPPSTVVINNYTNVTVVVDQSVTVNNVYYNPIRMDNFVDDGWDTQYNMTRVILDDGSRAWGHWNGSAGNGGSFAIVQSEQFPGVSDPMPGLAPQWMDVAKETSTAAPAQNATVFWLSAAVVLFGGGLLLTKWKSIVGFFSGRGAHRH